MIEPPLNDDNEKIAQEFSEMLKGETAPDFVDEAMRGLAKGLYSFFYNLMIEGFRHDDAMQLTIEYLVANIRERGQG